MSLPDAALQNRTAEIGFNAFCLFINDGVCTDCLSIPQESKLPAAGLAPLQSPPPAHPSPGRAIRYVSSALCADGVYGAANIVGQ
eukprot:73604-Rhodomonas_salina.2